MKTETRVAAGLAVFLAAGFFQVPHLRHPAWAHALLNFSALVLAPLLLDLAEDDADTGRMRRLRALLAQIQFPAALLLGVACAMAPGVWAVAAALPWAGVLVSVAALGAWRIICRDERLSPRTCRDIGLIYAAVGAGWLLADRLGLHPLGFSDEIVLLTAVHFHYAGWLLPMIAALVLEKAKPSLLRACAGGAVVAGVPAVAVGITTTQLGFGRTPEAIAALWLASAAIGVALFQVRLALESRRPPMVRGLWLVSAGSLSVGMAFAALYGVRIFFHPWPWLDLSWMRALHGSANALGFGFCGALGWWIEQRPRRGAN